ncbi:MAG: hypothetical protein AAGL17_19295, partial [Cyanobacteria bacterium J06576_12]
SEGTECKQEINEVDLHSAIEQVWKLNLGDDQSRALIPQLSAHGRASFERLVASYLDQSDHEFMLSEKTEVGFLRLIAYSKFHSDGLAYLPQDIRLNKIRSLSADFGIAEHVVRKAIALGPAQIDQTLNQ